MCLTSQTLHWAREAWRKDGKKGWREEGRKKASKEGRKERKNGLCIGPAGEAGLSTGTWRKEVRKGRREKGRKKARKERRDRRTDRRKERRKKDRYPAGSFGSFARRSVQPGIYSIQVSILHNAQTWQYPISGLWVANARRTLRRPTMPSESKFS